MHDRTGQQLGNYRLLHPLGQGGFANVYLAEHTHLNRRAAVKVLHEQLEAHARENFLREAKTIATLKHPQILRVLDYGMDDSTPFLVMEYAPGGTLRKKHPHGSIVPLSLIVPYVKQVTAALQYAHDRQLVHRDVKPENMLIEVQGSIVLGDFGIAITAYDTQKFTTQDVGGTPYYMAPEQCRGKARAASDQYALAIVVYEWLCGMLPFYGSSAIEIAMHHLMDTPAPLKHRMPSVPLEVERVVLRALAKDPQERFPTVQTFAQALEQASHPKKSAIAVLPLSILLAQQANNHEQPLVAPEERATFVLPTQASRPTIPLTSVLPSAGTLLLTYRGHLHALRTENQPARHTSVVSLANAETLQLRYPTTRPLLEPHRPRTAVSTLAWSPDGRYIASAGWDKVVQLWHASTGEQIRMYRGHSRFVFAVAWSPDGTRIASASSDRTVHVWHAGAGQQIRFSDHHRGFVFAVAWSPDGKHIACGGGDKILWLWNAENGDREQQYQGHGDAISRIAWSPDGTRIASASHDKTVQIWHCQTGEQIYRYHSHAHAVLTVAWSPDSRYLASAGSDGTVQIWEANTGQQLCTYRNHDQVVHAVAWSPDGTRIASASGDKTVQIWEMITGKLLFTYHGHNDSINAVAWSPHATQIASASKDGTVQIWQV